MGLLCNFGHCLAGISHSGILRPKQCVVLLWAMQSSISSHWSFLDMWDVSVQKYPPQDFHYCQYNSETCTWSAFEAVKTVVSILKNIFLRLIHMYADVLEWNASISQQFRKSLFYDCRWPTRVSVYNVHTKGGRKPLWNGKYAIDHQGQHNSINIVGVIYCPLHRGWERSNNKEVNVNWDPLQGGGLSNVHLQRLRHIMLPCRMAGYVCVCAWYKGMLWVTYIGISVWFTAVTRPSLACVDWRIELVIVTSHAVLLSSYQQWWPLNQIITCQIR